MCLQSVCVCVCIFTSVCFCWTTEWYFFSFVKCMHLLFLKGRCVVLRQHWFTMELILILLICLKLPWLDDEGPCVCVCMIKSGGIGGLCYFKLCVWTVQYYICFVFFFFWLHPALLWMVFVYRMYYSHAVQGKTFSLRQSYGHKLILHQ